MQTVASASQNARLEVIDRITQLLRANFEQTFSPNLDGELELPLFPSLTVVGPQDCPAYILCTRR
jgi:hypothetical protein